MRVLAAVWLIGLTGVVTAASCGHDASGAANDLPALVVASPASARHLDPSYSPDGKRIAFWARSTDSLGGWTLWVSDARSTSADARAYVTLGRLMDPPQPLWSKDGSRLLASSNAYGSSQVVVIRVADGSVERVSQSKGVAFPSAWFPDGKRVTYCASAGAELLRCYLATLGTDASVIAVPDETRPVFNVVPSPDGSRIAYVVINGPSTTIWVADADGTHRRQLTTEGFETLEQGNEWSPDGKELLYESTRTGRSDLWIAPIDGTRPRQLTRDIRNDFGGAWSPDGKWIGFISDRGRQRDVWVVPSAGGVERRVTDSPIEEHAPLTWRPGTLTLTFTSEQRHDGIWMLDLATGAERRLTPDSIRANQFTVSRDGRQVAYVVEQGGAINDLAIVPIEGGEARTIIAGGGSVDDPSWSPDGTKILFTSDRGGSEDVWVMDAAGGSPRQLENWSGFEGPAVWSGDGSMIYFNSDRDSRLIDIWRVPAAGGQPTRVTNDGASGKVGTRAGVRAVFTQAVGKTGGQVSIARITDDGRTNVVWDKSNAVLVSISPSGDSLAAVVDQQDGQQRSMILSSNGTGGRVVLKAGEMIGDWSNDGKSVLFSISGGGTRDIAILDLAAGTTRRLTTTPQDEWAGQFTPDGKTVVFVRSQTVQQIVSVDLSRMLNAPSRGR